MADNRYIRSIPTISQKKLLSSFKAGKLDDFKKLIKHDGVDVNYFYGEPENGRLLDLACRSAGNSRFVQILIENKTSTQFRNDVTGKYAIHEAVDKSDADTLQILLRANAELIKQIDKYGNSPLQTAVKRNNVELIRILLECRTQDENEINISTWQNPTPLHLSLHLGHTETAQVLLEYSNVDLDFQRDSEGRTCRQIIQQQYPQLKALLPNRSNCDYKQILKSLLHRGETELFADLVSEVSTEFLDDCYMTGNMTYLHYACVHNYINVVEVLLKKKVQTNELASNPYNMGKSETPIMMAAYLGHYDIFYKLSTVPEIELQTEGVGSVLHSAIRGMCEKTVSGDDHRIILNVLLDRESVTAHKLNIDQTDENGKTALHIAISFNNELAIRSLVYAGANLYIKNPKGKLPLTSIPATILEGYLDNCIDSRNCLRTGSIEEINFNCNVFRRLDQNLIATGYEMEFFTLIERVPELRKLIEHPISKSFLYVKWRLVKKYYLVNLAFCLSFCLVFSAYIFQIHDCSLPSTDFGPTHDRDFKLHKFPILCNAWWLQPITLLLYVIFILRELWRFFTSIWLYFRLPENWLKVIIILIVGIFYTSETNANLEAIVILLTWFELLSLLCKYPSFSIYAEMFKTVAINSAKLFAVYSILIATFAYSFYISFIDEPKMSYLWLRLQFDWITSWQELTTSLMKKTRMLTSDPSHRNVDANFSYYRLLIVILFFFLVAVVLHNLFFGLAVSNTRNIIKNAEMIALTSQVKVISQLERQAVGIPFQYLCSSRINLFNCRTVRQLENGCSTFCSKIYGSERILLTKSAADVIVSMRSSKNNMISLTNGSGGNIGRMPSAIVKQAEQILQKRSRSNFAKNTYEYSPVLVDAEEKRASKHESLDELAHLIHDLKLEMDAKIAERDEKLLRSVDERNEKLLQTVLQALADQKRKE